MILQEDVIRIWTKIQNALMEMINEILEVEGEPSTVVHSSESRIPVRLGFRGKKLLCFLKLTQTAGLSAFSLLFHRCILLKLLLTRHSAFVEHISGMDTAFMDLTLGDKNDPSQGKRHSLSDFVHKGYHLVRKLYRPLCEFVDDVSLFKPTCFLSLPYGHRCRFLLPPVFSCRPDHAFSSS